MSITTSNNTITTIPATITYIPTTITTTGGYVDVSGTTYYAPHNNITFPPSYKFEFTSPVNKRIAFLRMPCGFSKYDLFNKLGRLPDDIFIVNTFHDTLSNSIIFMMTSDKFVMVDEGTALPEIIIDGETWDYRTRSEFTKRVEERND